MEDVQYLGLWWVPTNERNKVAGTLAYSQGGGIRLSLTGSFYQPHFYGDLESYPVVLGQTNRGEFITLRSCQQVKYQPNIPGFPVEDVIADELYVGKAESALDLQHFHRATLTYTYLTHWFAVTGFSSRDSFKPDGYPSRVDLQYVFPESVEVAVFGTRISIGPTLHREIKTFRYNLRQSVSVTFDSPQALTLAEWQQKWFVPFQNFLTFATGKPNRITNLSVFSRKNARVSSNGDVVPLPINVFYRQLSSHSEYNENFATQDMLFSYRDIREDVQKVFESWFRLSTTLETVSALLFVTQYSLSPFLNPRYLSVVQAVEIYHRRRFPGYVMPKDRYENYRRLILARMVQSQRKWLSKVLEYANEPRLYDRVQQLLDAANEVVAPLVGNTERFARKVTNTRNYLTHYNRKLKKNAAHEFDLYWITETLVVLVQWSLLIELGLSPEQCSALFRQNRQYKNILEHAPKY